MKKLLTTVLVLVYVFSSAVTAQVRTISQLEANEELDLHSGFMPNSLASLVASSTIVVKGRLGAYLGNEPFYGYNDVSRENDTRESLAEKLNIDIETADRLAIPVSSYELVIDEVLFGRGAIKSDTIIFTLMEMEPQNRKASDPAVDRLFFLVADQTGETFGAMGLTSIFSEDGKGNYKPQPVGFIPEGVTIPDEVLNPTLRFEVDLNIDSFDQTVRAEIEKL